MEGTESVDDTNIEKEERATFNPEKFSSEAGNKSNGLNDNKLDELIRNVDGLWECTKCGKTDMSKYGIKRHAEIHLEYSTFICKHCNKTLKTRDALRGHISYHHSDKSFVCSICGKSGMTKRQLGDHMHRSTHGKCQKCSSLGGCNCRVSGVDKSGNKLDTDVTDATSTFNEICNEQRDFEFPADFIKLETEIVEVKVDVEVEENNDFKHELETKDYFENKVKNGDDLNVKLSDEEQVNKFLDAELKFEDIPVKTELDEELSEGNEEKLVDDKKSNRKQCPVCLKSYTKDSLFEHMYFHKGETTCHECGKVYQHKAALRLHQLNVHTKKFSHVCEVCGYKTNQKTKLGFHMRTHTGEKPLMCDLCDYRCADPSALNHHIRKNHTNPTIEKIASPQPPFYCASCGKSFGYMCRLKRHEAIHAEGKQPRWPKTHIESNIKCSVCGKCFRYMSRLRRHELTHADGKEPRFSMQSAESIIKCSVCDETFSHLKSLSDHKNEKHAKNKTQDSFTKC